MRSRITTTTWCCLLAFLFCMELPNAKAGMMVKAGYDLLTTVSGGTSFNGVKFKGVPLSNFDFGGTIGVKNLTNTNIDTIIQRTSDVATDGGSTPIQIIALQLQTIVATDFGGMLPTDFYFATLQTARTLAEVGTLGAGTTSTGSLVIHFNAMEPIVPTNQHGTFDTTGYDVHFDLRKGSLTGVIVGSGTTNLNSSGTKWAHVVPNAVAIDGVNRLLNGTDVSNDFFFGELHNGPHSVTSATPEPSSLLLAGLAAASALMFQVRRRLVRRTAVLRS